MQANLQRKKIEWKKKKESKYPLVSLLCWWLRAYRCSSVAGWMLNVQKQQHAKGWLVRVSRKSSALELKRQVLPPWAVERISVFIPMCKIRMKMQIFHKPVIALFA